VILIRPFIRFSLIPVQVDVRAVRALTILLLPLAAQTQTSNSPFDTGFTARPADSFHRDDCQGRVANCDRDRRLRLRTRRARSEEISNVAVNVGTR